MNNLYACYPIIAHKLCKGDDGSAVEILCARKISEAKGILTHQ